MEPSQLSSDNGESSQTKSLSQFESSEDPSLEFSDAECEDALQKFVEITKTDEACAHFFLQDVKWRLQPALERFFSYAPDDEEEEKKKEGETTDSAKSSESVATALENNFKLSVLSWNIDGLDECNLKSRFTAVCFIISKLASDVVFLQEMTPDLVPQIKENLSGEYSILIATPNQPYFTVILLKPDLELVVHKAIPYKNSGMGRSMQLAEVWCYGHKLKLLNTHLESMKEHSSIRVTQLGECYEQLKEWDDGKSIIIFGGDLNLRDEEVGDIPAGFQDAWIAAGENPKCKYTWDASLNDNKCAGTARCRFDRIFFKSNVAFSEIIFSLEGKDRIRNSLCFPSDHWAIHATFQ